MEANDVTCEFPVHLETNVMGLWWGWKKTVWDSWGNVVLFHFYGAPSGRKPCFQTVEESLL